MNKSKSSVKNRRDRLSELPDSLITEIFGWLPMTDVVRTTVLSKRWRNLWTTSPYLNFEYKVYTAADSVQKFVNQALMLWRGIKILKFKIILCWPMPLPSDLSLWLNFATEKGVEELYVKKKSTYFRSQQNAWVLPQCLYSCSSLKVLSLISCSLDGGNINMNVQWNQLKSLTIDDTYEYWDETLINQILCGTPQLEVFNLSLTSVSGNLSIRSSSLKKLLIMTSFIGYAEDYHLTICTPNLETLALSGESYQEFCSINVPSLINVTLGIDNPQCLLGLFSQHVDQNLTLSPEHDKVVVVKEKYLVSPFLNVKFLELKEYSGEAEVIMDLLELFPKLNTLVLNDILHLMKPFKNERNFPSSFLLQLKTVDLTLHYDGKWMFPFIEILLKYASNLDQIVIQNEASSDTLFLASRMLLGMPRSSPNAQLVFL